MTPIKKARSEGNLTAKLPVTKVSEEMREEVFQVANEEDVSMGDVIREAVEVFLAKRKKSSKK